MDKPVVLIDVDDVLCQTRFEIERMLQEAYGVNISHHDIIEFDIGKSIGIPFCPQTAHKHRLLEEGKVEPGAVDLVNYLRSMGYYIAIVTAREWHPEGRSVTERWLNEGGIHFDALHVVDMEISKRDVALKYANIELCIDDHVSHVRDYLGLPHVRNVALIDRPWNKGEHHKAMLDKGGYGERFYRCFHLDQVMAMVARVHDKADLEACYE